MSEYPCIYIITVNYNNWQDTVQCLESVFRNQYPYYRVILVDNHSTDQSLDFIRQWAAGQLCSWTPSHDRLRYLSLPPVGKPISCQEFTEQELHDLPESRPALVDYPRLIIVRNSQNKGFAAGNNLGLQFARKAGGQYFLLLNNDTVVEPDFLFPMINTAQADAGIGMVGGKIMYYHEPAVIWAAGGGKITRLTSGMRHMGADQPDNPRYRSPFDCDYITGCLLLITESVIRKIGLMDENYFLYYEETDWNLKAMQAGYRRVFVPDSVIYHKASVSLSNQNLLTIYYYTRNRIYLVIKNYRKPLRGFTLIYLFFYNTLRIFFNLLKMNPAKSRMIALACRHGWRRKMGKFETCTEKNENLKA